MLEPTSNFRHLCRSSPSSWTPPVTPNGFRKLQVVYNSPRSEDGRFLPTSGRTLRRKYTMKRSLRALLLLVGLVGTFAFAAAPRVPTPGGPFPCPPSHPQCDVDTIT